VRIQIFSILVVGIVGGGGIQPSWAQVIPSVAGNLSGAAAAGDVSRGAAAGLSMPTLPENPQSPTDFQGLTNLPQAAPSTESHGEEERIISTTPSGFSGFEGSDMIISDEGSSHLSSSDGERPMVGPIPAFHTVKKGETLWSLCENYYHDPWRWPQLWAYNPLITNPHWIYPGDKIRLIGGKGGPAPREKSADGGDAIRFSDGRIFSDRPIELRQTGFVHRKDRDQVGSIIGSREERILLSTHDEIYIDPSDKFRPKVGGTYSIYRALDSLQGENGNEIGTLVEILGTVEIKQAPKGKYVTGRITETLKSIERDDKVGPLQRVYRRPSQRPATKDLNGKIIATIQPGLHFGTHEIIFIDKGKRNGLLEGNRLLVMGRGDGYQRLLTQEDDKDEKYPWEAVAEISILDTFDDASVAVINRAIREVKKGDLVQMKRGY